MKKNRSKINVGPPNPVDRSDPLNSSGMLRAQQITAENCMAMSSEIVNFWRTRFEKDRALGQSLAGCRDWNAFSAIQKEWAAEAMADYLAEARKMIELGSAAIRTADQTVAETRRDESGDAG